MPGGLMLILVVYLLRGVPGAAAPTAVATVGAAI
jgi:hypothetical protein